MAKKAKQGAKPGGGGTNWSAGDRRIAEKAVARQKSRAEEKKAGVVVDRLLERLIPLNASMMAAGLDADGEGGSRSAKKRYSRKVGRAGRAALDSGRGRSRRRKRSESGSDTESESEEDVSDDDHRRRRRRRRSRSRGGDDIADVRDEI